MPTGSGDAFRGDETSQAINGSGLSALCVDCEADLSEGLKKLAALEDSLKETLQPCGNVTGVSHSSRLNSWNCAGNYGGGGEI